MRLGSLRQGRSDRVAWVFTIEGKLTLAFLLLVLVVVAIIGGSAYIQSEKALEESSSNSLQSQVQISSDYVTDWLNQRMTDMNTLAGISQLRSMDAGQAGTIVQKYFQQWKIYETIILTGLDGKSITASDGGSYDLSIRDYYQQVLQNQTVISEPVVSLATGNIIFVVAAPVYSVNDPSKLVGMIVGTLPTKQFDQVLSASFTGKTGEAFLVNQDGFFITPSRFTDQLKSEGLIKDRSELELKANDGVVQRIQAKQTGTSSYVDYRGQKVISAYAPIPLVGWGLVIKQDTSEAYARAYALRNSLAMILALVIVFSVTLSIIFARTLSRPIRAMAGAAQALAVGDIDQNIAYRNKDEVGQLADSFRQLIHYQQSMAQAADQIANGILTAEIEPASEKDALGNSFHKMIDNLRAQIGSISLSANTLKAASGQLSIAADQAGRATSQIAATIQQITAGISQQSDAIGRTTMPVDQMVQTINGIANGAQEQARAIEHTSDLTSQLNESIRQVSENAEAVSKGSTSATQEAQNGQNTIGQTIAGMENIRQKVQLSSKKMAEMDQRSNQIGIIVETIEDIATQTNLLALNAAIEAARAGEHGKGFAVVADEVRKLAERSSASTREIGELIKGIQVTVNEAVTAMQESAQEVENGVVNVNNAGTVLHSILTAVEWASRQAQQASIAAQIMSTSAGKMTQAVESVSAVIEENTAATEQMAAGSSEISTAIENIASVSEENSAAIEEVSASTEEMSAQVEEVSASAQSLADMADELEQVVAQFVIE